MVAYPDRGAGNDPEPFFFFFLGGGGGSLSQPRLNIFTVGNMRVMICLGQGGLRSLSASSFTIHFRLHVHIYSQCYVIVLPIMPGSLIDCSIETTTIYYHNSAIIHCSM